MIELSDASLLKDGVKLKSTTERRQGIIRVLCVRRFETYDNLARDFGVSKMTIRRDIEILSCTLPIYSVSGRGGGVRVADGYNDFKGYIRYLNKNQVDLLHELLPTLCPPQQAIIKSILNDFSAPT